MSYKIQLKDARNSLAFKSIAGLCTDGDAFLEVLNEAMRRLNRRGNFFDTEILMRLCAYNGCLTWPRYVGTVMAIRPCHCGPMEIRNNWYSMVGPGSCFRSNHVMVDAGTAPCYNEITGEDGKNIRAIPTVLEDVGKFITIFGMDVNGQPLKEKKDGMWQQGLTIRLQLPHGQTSVLVRTITSVVKDVTQANVLLYEFDVASSTMRDLAVYEPSETNPRYRRSVIKGFDCLPSSCPVVNGVKMRTIEALVKLEFIDVRHDKDFLPLDNLDAIKFAIAAIRLEEANQDEAAEVKWIKAIRELTFEQREKSPGNQLVVRVNATPYMTNPI